MTEDHITCQEVVDLVTDYVERALPPDEASLFEEHLASCDGCVRYVHQVREAVAASEHVRETDIPPDVRDNLMAVFRDWKSG